jgi:hypothetical protein
MVGTFPAAWAARWRRKAMNLGVMRPPVSIAMGTYVVEALFLRVFDVRLVLFLLGDEGGGAGGGGRFAFGVAVGVDRVSDDDVADEPVYRPASQSADEDVGAGVAL